MSLRDPKSLDVTQYENAGYDTAIERLRAALEGLPWLEKSLGRAYSLPRQNADGDIQIIPKVFTGGPISSNSKKKAYEDMLPNDRLSAFSFIVGRDPASLVDEVEPFSQFLRFSRPTDVIFSLRYDVIDKNTPYPFNDVLMEDITLIVQRVAGFQLTEFVTEDLQEVWLGFTLTEVESKYFHFPYGGIRLRGTLSYEVQCT